jgi:hypothetical protein
LKQHGCRSAESDAPSKASPVISGWRQSIWFLRISVSRARPEKILALSPLPAPVNLARQPPHYPEVRAGLRTSHAGAEGSIIIGTRREKTDLPFGWNAQAGEYGDLDAQGVIDPAKVVRTALQDAASVAGLLVTSEAMIAENPKKEAAPALPPGAGMDF